LYVVPAAAAVNIAEELQSVQRKRKDWPAELRQLGRDEAGVRSMLNRVFRFASGHPRTLECLIATPPNKCERLEVEGLSIRNVALMSVVCRGFNYDVENAYS
jgi:hypothetical protein